MLLTSSDVLEQRRLYSEMPGVSFASLCYGYTPAFRDEQTGETHLSLNDDGSVAVIHVIDNLPFEWIEEWDAHGRAVTLKGTVTPGFLRGESFYTLTQLQEKPLDS